MIPELEKIILRRHLTTPSQRDSIVPKDIEALKQQLQKKAENAKDQRLDRTDTSRKSFSPVNRTPRHSEKPSPGAFSQESDNNFNKLRSTQPANTESTNDLRQSKRLSQIDNRHRHFISDSLDIEQGPTMNMASKVSGQVAKRRSSLNRGEPPKVARTSGAGGTSASMSEHWDDGTTGENMPPQRRPSASSTGDRRPESTAPDTGGASSPHPAQSASQSASRLLQYLHEEPENIKEALRQLESGESIGDSAISIMLKLLVPESHYLVDPLGSKENSLAPKRSLPGDAQKLVLPMCDEIHWVVAFIDLTSSTVDLVDSLSNGSNSQHWHLRLADYQKRLSANEASRVESDASGNGLAKEPRWKITDVKSPQQTDVVNCGIYATVAALLRTNNQELPSSFHAPTARATLSAFLEKIYRETCSAKQSTPRISLPGTDFPEGEDFSRHVKGTTENYTELLECISKLKESRQVLMRSYLQTLEKVLSTLKMIASVMSRRMEQASSIQERGQNNTRYLQAHLKSLEQAAKTAQPLPADVQRNLGDSTYQQDLKHIRKALERETSVTEIEHIVANVLRSMSRAIDVFCQELDERKKRAEQD